MSYLACAMASGIGRLLLFVVAGEPGVPSPPQPAPNQSVEAANKPRTPRIVHVPFTVVVSPEDQS